MNRSGFASCLIVMILLQCKKQKLLYVLTDGGQTNQTFFLSKSKFASLFLCMSLRLLSSLLLLALFIIVIEGTVANRVVSVG